MGTKRQMFEYRPNQIKSNQKKSDRTCQNVHAHLSERAQGCLEHGSHQSDLGHFGTAQFANGATGLTLIGFTGRQGLSEGGHQVFVLLSLHPRIESLRIAFGRRYVFRQETEQGHRPQVAELLFDDLRRLLHFDGVRALVGAGEPSEDRVPLGQVGLFRRHVVLAVFQQAAHKTLQRDRKITERKKINEKSMKIGDDSFIPRTADKVSGAEDSPPPVGPYG